MDSCKYCRKYHAPHKVCAGYIKAMKQGKIAIDAIEDCLDEDTDPDTVFDKLFIARKKITDL